MTVFGMEDNRTTSDHGVGVERRLNAESLTVITQHARNIYSSRPLLHRPRCMVPTPSFDEFRLLLVYVRICEDILPHRDDGIW